MPPILRPAKSASAARAQQLHERKGESMPPILPPDVIGQFENFPAPQPVLLSVYLANVTAYYQDTVDLTLLARQPNAPINTANLAKNNFLPLEVVADIVQINDDTTVKGLYLSKNLVTKSSPTAAAGSGTMISDATITGFRQDIFKILYPDPMATPPTTMEIGSITASGVSGKDVPPGGPLAPGGTPVIGGGDWAITGGTGAFLGVTGQMGGQGGTGTGLIRAASVTEDPSYRKANASPNDIATMFLNVISMMPPQIIPVLPPAQAGHPLTLYATGLGPVRYQSGATWVDVPIGQPFPADTTVISPVTITIGSTSIPIAPLNAQGVPGFSNGYQVEFTVPNLAPGHYSIQISSAWIQSAAATLHVVP
jgi:hypothetical protein